jgi:hypothetical protein
MLSIGKLAAGRDAARYYEEAVARGREDYYRGEGEAPAAGSAAVPSASVSPARSPRAKSADFSMVPSPAPDACLGGRSRRDRSPDST